MPRGDRPAGGDHRHRRGVLDPDHVIAHLKGDKVKEVRQPINICLHARQVGGELTRTREAAEVAWVAAADREDYDIHPAIRLRIAHGLSSAEPHLG